jgi:metallo-beta-lactamase class B
MRRVFVAALAAGMLQIGGAVAQTSEIDQHMNAARAAAGLDFRSTFINLCLPAAPRPANAAPSGPRPTPDRATWYAAPYKVFDNLYWLGTRQHSSWR